jgi:AraC-like DNA-binding protein
MKAGPHFEPHLAIHEITLPPSAEWVPRFTGYSFILVRSGVGYWQAPNGPRELSAGWGLALAGNAQGVFRASQLSAVEAAYFLVEPERLTGLLSLEEQRLLKRAAARDELVSRVLSPENPQAEQFNTLCVARKAPSFSLRFQLLQLFNDLFDDALREDEADAGPALEAKTRLRQLLKEMTASEFAEVSLADLAARLHCTPRHLSRLFREEMGISFSEKQTQLRLGKASQLLATTDAKVIDVGSASGYQSNSLFSLMFKKHFGLSPGKWRQQQKKKQPARQKVVRMLSV